MIEKSQAVVGAILVRKTDKTLKVKIIKKGWCGKLPVFLLEREIGVAETVTFADLQKDYELDESSPVRF